MSSPYQIRPEHVQWLQNQLSQRQINLSQGSLLSLMTDFWAKNGSRLSVKKIQEDVAVQILNNKLLDVLLSRFQKNPAYTAKEANAINQVVKGMEQMPPISSDGQPNQTPQWVDRPSMGSLRTMKASEMDERVSQFNLDRDSLFPKPKPVNFTKDQELSPEGVPTVPTDTLYEQILMEREKQAKELGLSALSPSVVNEPNQPEGSSLSTSLNALQNASVKESNPSGNQELELRIANTLPRPVQGSRTNAGDPSGKRPMPRNLPTGGTPTPELTPMSAEIQLPPIQKIDAPAFTSQIPDSVAIDTGRLLPQNMDNQTRVPSREEFMKMAERQAQADFRTSGNQEVYDATGVFASVKQISSSRAISDPVAVSTTSTLASVPKKTEDDKSKQMNTMSQPNNVNGIGYSASNNGSVSENFTPYGPSFPGSTSSGMGAREDWRQNRDLYQASLSGGPLPNPISQIGKPILPTYIPEYQTYHWYLTIDSINRDLEHYPNPAYFQVRFEEPSTSIEVPTRLGTDGVVIYETPRVYEYTGGFGAKMERVYKNIVSISCPHAIIPMDINFVYGRSPYEFNGPVLDQNKVADSNNFGSYPYGPIFKNATTDPVYGPTGILSDILEEPYLCMHVEELDGLYDGTNKSIRNSLSVLTYDSRYASNAYRPFVHFTTTMGEKKVYTPTALGELSQMTIRLLKRNNKLVEMGVDKTFIASITEGDAVPAGVCDLPTGSHLTKITISPTNSQYPCGSLCGADVFPGNLLYFYTKYGCNPVVDATSLNSSITMNLTGYPTATFVMYEPSVYSGQVTLDVSPFLSVGDLIVVNKEYLFDVVGISENGKSVTLNSRDTTIIPASLTITSVGYIKKNGRGYQSEEKVYFNYEGGKYVVKGAEGLVSPDPFTFQINYAFENLPDYLKTYDAVSAPNGTFQPDEAFFIRQNKQIIYSVEVVVLQPRTDQLTSRIFTDGGRPM